MIEPGTEESRGVVEIPGEPCVTGVRVRIVRSRAEASGDRGRTTNDRLHFPIPFEIARVRALDGTVRGVQRHFVERIREPLGPVLRELLRVPPRKRVPRDEVV